MELWVWIVLAIAIVIGIGMAALALWQENQRRTTRDLRSQFGPVYDETLMAHGDKREAERELKHRQSRVERLRLRPLSADERSRLEQQWASIQSSFIDDPVAAAQEADDLIDAALTNRGYPEADFERRLDDLSVEHPEAVRRYRVARSTATREDADTEAMRQAMIEYRAIFVQLANADVEVPAMPPRLARAS